MHIAIVGPTHPYKGGIPHHTTALAHHLQAAGHDVDIISWSAQYPAFLYPGVQHVPEDQPEMKVFEPTSYPLSWKSPLSWRKVGYKLRGYDLSILVMASPVQAPAYLTMLQAMGKKYRRKVVALSHNVLPHEPRIMDIPLTKAVFKRVGHVLVHTQTQAALAVKLSDTPVIAADMPPHLPGYDSSKPQKSRAKNIHHQLLFFGLVRPYKGVDILLQALSKVPTISLTIAGEIWGDKTKYTDLIKDLNLTKRVKIKGSYIPAHEIATLFEHADALVLPYRSGTGTQNVTMAHAYGVPVIATKVGAMADQVHNGVDGLLCEPDNVDSLVRAIKKLYEPGIISTLQKNIPAFSDTEEWNQYITALLSAVKEQ